MFTLGDVLNHKREMKQLHKMQVTAICYKGLDRAPYAAWIFEYEAPGRDWYSGSANNRIKEFLIEHQLDDYDHENDYILIGSVNYKEVNGFKFDYIL